MLDEYTVQLRSEEPFGPIQVHLAHSGIGMISPAVLARGKDYVAANPVGTGPFVMEEWRQGEQVVIRKRDDYWGEPAKLDRIVFRQIVDDGARLSNWRRARRTWPFASRPPNGSGSTPTRI